MSTISQTDYNIFKITICFQKLQTSTFHLLSTHNVRTRQLIVTISSNMINKHKSNKYCISSSTNDGPNKQIHTSNLQSLQTKKQSNNPETIPTTTIHNNDTHYKAEYHTKIFKQKSNLTRQLAIHNQKKSYKCEHCGKTFTRKQNRQKHLIIHTNERPYKCEHCSKAFNRKYSWQRHLLTHKIERPYKCQQVHCNKTFKSKPNLNKHQITHNNYKEFKCDQCPYESKWKSNLTSHLKKHNDKAIPECQQCNKTFKHKPEQFGNTKPLIHTNANKISKSIHLKCTSINNASLIIKIFLKPTHP